jgi:hypothetical protein
MQRASSKARIARTHTRRTRAYLFTALAWSSASALLVGGMTVSGARPAFASSGSPHVMVVVMENKNYSDVIGQSNQPFTNSLATQYGLATQSYAVTHPSLGNYIDLVSGQHPGNANDDGPPSSHTYSYTTLADQLHSAGISEKAYAENLPGDPTNDSYPYVVRHFPWVYFPGSSSMPIANASSLVSDLNGSGAPAFVWYTPNVVNDEHDGSVQQGDNFLRSLIPSVQSTNWYKSGGQIIVTWDESNSDSANGGGRVATIVVSAALKASPKQSATMVDTTGLLNSIEDVYGVGHLASGKGTIDALLSASGSGANRFITNPSRATAFAGKSFAFLITTSGSPMPKLKKKGKLPAGLHFRNNHDGTAWISGIPNPKKAPGTHQVIIMATYDKGKAKQITTQVLTLTVSP